MRDRFTSGEARARHPEGHEKQLACRGLVGLAGDDLDEASEQREARVRVVPDLAKRRDLLELGHRGDVALEGIVSVAEVGEAVPEPATGVRHQMVDRRALLSGGIAEAERGDVTAHRRVEIESAALDEPHDHRGRHRLGDRRDLEQRVAVDRKRMLDARHAERRDVELVRADHPDRDAGYAVALHGVAHEGVERGVHESRC